MRIFIDVPDYDGNGIDVLWEKGANYKLEVDENEVLLTANKLGLIAFAKQMLYMAYNDLPHGSHVHYDSFFTKINNLNFELIIAQENDHKTR